MAFWLFKRQARKSRRENANIRNRIVTMRQTMKELERIHAIVSGG